MYQNHRRPDEPTLLHPFLTQWAWRRAEDAADAAGARSLPEEGTMSHTQLYPGPSTALHTQLAPTKYLLNELPLKRSFLETTLLLAYVYSLLASCTHTFISLMQTTLKKTPYLGQFIARILMKKKIAWRGHNYLCPHWKPRDGLLKGSSRCQKPEP